MSKKSTPLTLAKTEPDKPAPMKEFDRARAHIAKIGELGRRAQHEMLLFGLELNKLKKELEPKRGGDQKSEKSKLHGATLIPWKDLVSQQTGQSYDTCHRWMEIAKGASKSLPILMAKDVLEKPFSALPEARRMEVEKVLNKAVDGQTMHQLMLSFGVWKDKAHKSPPKPTKQSAENRSENASNQTLTAAQFMAQAKDEINVLHDMHIGGSWNYLDEADLADLENKLTAYLADVSAKLKGGKGAK